MTPDRLLRFVFGVFLASIVLGVLLGARILPASPLVAVVAGGVLGFVGAIAADVILADRT
jgi:hypothetical protein